MHQTLNLLRGSVEVEITGPFPERLLNLCAQQNVAFWDMRRDTEGRLRAWMLPSGYKMLRPLAGKSGCRVHILRKKGAPFFLWHFRDRAVLWVGIMLLTAFFFTMSLFVWEIEVVGNEKTDSGAILRHLAENGVRIGAYTSSIQSEAVKHAMLLKIKDLSWLTVNIQGCKATVEVRERVPPPEIIPRETPCNVIARKSGLIESIDTMAGASQVTVGEMVREGQLLVSGLIDSVQVGMRAEHAMARVMARTWEEMTVVTPRQTVLKAYTGRVHKRYSLALAGRRVNLYFDSSQPFDRCDKIEKRSRPGIMPGLSFPLVWIEETYREYEGAVKQAEPARIDALFRLSLENQLEKRVWGEILAMDYTFEEDDSVYKGHLTAEALEEISLSRVILLQ